MEKSFQWQTEILSCVMLIYKTDFWVAEYKILILMKLAVFVSSGVIEEHRIIVQQLDRVGCQH